MNKVVWLGCIVSALVLLNACGITKPNANNDYRRAKLDEPLTIPEGFNGNRISDYYAIPPVRAGLVDAEAEVPKPPALSLADEGHLVKIQRLSGDSWVLVKLVPGQVWPLVAQYASQSGMVITREQARQGYLETGWLQKPEQTTLREKYRFLVRQGVQRNSTEVVVQQYEELQDMPERAIEWRSNAIDPDSAEKTMRSLAEYLASYADPTSAVSLRAQNIDTSSRIYFKQLDDTPAVFIEINQDKGFASAQYALENSGFVIEDLNFSEGLLYARSAINENLKVGWFKRLTGRGKKTVWPDTNYQFKLKPSAEKGWYQMTVSPEKSLDNNALKDILKEVKRHFT